MSEHLSINGECNYWHLPYDEEGAFTFCNHCKKTCERITVEFHEGICEDWMVVRCPKCKQAIWTSKLKRKIEKNNRKCSNCKKPVSWINNFSQVSGGKLGQRTRTYCSKKCYEKKEGKIFV